MPIRLPSHFQIHLEPLSQPEAIVLGPQVRFTVLTSRLVRVEHSPTEEFQDRASQVFWYRRQPVPQFEVIRSLERIEIITEHLHLRYFVQPEGFARDSLSITLKASNTTWRYGDRDRRNLRGAARTLDQANGAIQLEPGLLSRSGWAVVDDSRSLVFNDQRWLEPRASAGHDLYFFGYGHDYRACLQDFARVAGATPLIPRFVLGNWWSRYWAYSQDELAQLVSEFRAHRVPLSVCIVDMDWHITETGNSSTGWTGYTWNRDLFPDPEGFIRWLHEQGLKTALNLHPAEGIHPHEAAYETFARFMEIDPASQKPVSFDIADPKFTQGYFDILHHPMETQGVDFWWLDWQQGALSRLPGLDPLMWLNHLHFYDLGRDGRKRPFIFSRWGGLGGHRYPIGFSGDTVVSWESLSFQPHFTATAANVGYGWWSHDIGGHMSGIEDGELFTRWVQFGVFSPILRLHSTNNPYHERRPWGHDAKVFRVTREALQLRHALIPYLYTMAWRNHRESILLVTPMYHAHPEESDAYHCPNQYYYGSELVAAPFVSPRDPDTRLARQAVWLPAGDWFDFFTGEYFPGNRWHTLYGSLEDIPLFAKAGAIVPLGPQVEWDGVDNPAELTLYVFPGADNRFELYEDDGETTAYWQGARCITPFEQAWHGDQMQIRIGAAQGDTTLVPPERTCRLIIRGVRQPDQIEWSLNGLSSTPAVQYDEATETLELPAVTLKPTDELVLSLSVKEGALLSKRDRRIETCRKMLRAFRLESYTKLRIDGHLPEIIQDPNRLASVGSGLKDAHAAALTNVINRRPK